MFKGHNPMVQYLQQKTTHLIFISAFLGGNKTSQSKPSPPQLYYLDNNIHIQYHDMFRL
jgi:hypothetical protein